MAWTRYWTQRDEPGGVRKVLKCEKIYIRDSQLTARASRRARRAKAKSYIFYRFFSKLLVYIYNSNTFRPASAASRGGPKRKQANLMAFGPNYEHSDDYEDKVFVIETSYSNV